MLLCDNKKGAYPWLEFTPLSCDYFRTSVIYQVSDIYRFVGEIKEKAGPLLTLLECILFNLPIAQSRMVRTMKLHPLSGTSRFNPFVKIISHYTDKIFSQSVKSVFDPII